MVFRHKSSFQGVRFQLDHIAGNNKLILTYINSFHALPGRHSFYSNSGGAGVHFEICAKTSKKIYLFFPWSLHLQSPNIEANAYPKQF